MLISPSELRLSPRSTQDGSRAPIPYPGALSGVTDQSTTVAPWIRRTAWMANRVLTRSPSAVVHSASAATGSSGLVGAGGRVFSMLGDCVARLPKRPGSSLAYVQPAESTHVAAMTAASRFIAATPQFYGRPFCRAGGISWRHG